MDGRQDPSGIIRRLPQEDPRWDTESSARLLHVRYVGDVLCQNTRSERTAYLNRGKERGDTGAEEADFVRM